jgi:hypothetical protein
MTTKANSRLAGFAFLLYIIVGITDMNLSSRAIGSGTTAAKLASIAQHETLIRVSVVLTLVTALCALTLAATIYALTRDYDRDLALLAMLCRVVEGASNAVAASATLRLLSAAKTVAGGADATTVSAVGSVLLGGQATGTATLFAVGSTIYCYIFLRAHTIPIALAWLGVISSVLLVVCLPLQILGVMGPNWWMWMPALVFEVSFALWLMIKGVRQGEQRP